MRYKLGFIGCGNMGGALVKAASKSLRPEEIAVCDADENKTLYFTKTHGVAVATIEEIAEKSDFVVLGVKPQVLKNVVHSIATILCKRTDVTVITMAAGVSIVALQRFIGVALPVIRIMPNTPVTLGKGLILYTTSGVIETSVCNFKSYFSAAGAFDYLPEEQMDAASALSGCGPAFAYSFAEALADGAIACGVPKNQAQRYAAQTLLGAAEMLLEYGDPAALRNAVCSPGGTTLAGIRALNEADFHRITSSAVTAAYERTLELKQ